MAHESLEINDTNRAWQLVSWILLVAMILMTIWPFDLSPQSGFATDTGRIEAYGVIAGAFLMGFPHRILFAVSWPLVLALADELLPLAFLGHDFNVGDAIWKLFGIGIGVAIGIFSVKRPRNIASQSPSIQKGRSMPYRGPSSPSL
jgi:hypothetical protein